VAALVAVLDAVFGAARVLAERPRTRAALQQFMDTAGAGLLHRPDVVLAGWDGPGTYALIDIKTFDALSATAISSAHTDITRGARHDQVARASIESEYGGLQRIPPRMRLVIFEVSTGGSLGWRARAFLSGLQRRAGPSLPIGLLDQATWAVPRLAPFARMAVGMAVRRGIAEGVHECWDSTVAPPMPAFRLPGAPHFRFAPIGAGAAAGGAA
jgi:hypothetical protein